MQNWKRAVIGASAGSAAVMFWKRRPAAGLLLAGVGLAALASEYPEKFAEIREELPAYLERGSGMLAIAMRLGQRIAEIARDRGNAWQELLQSRR